MDTTALTIDYLLEMRDVDAEYVAELLVCFGKELYYAGKPYGMYSETINAVAALRPASRKSLAAAWDLAFSWFTDEPGAHHPAMPLAVLLAFSALALLWGWPREKAILLMAWSGILRVGEVLNGLRDHFFLAIQQLALTMFFFKLDSQRHVAQQQGINQHGLIQQMLAVYFQLSLETYLVTASYGSSRFACLAKRLAPSVLTT